MSQTESPSTKSDMKERERVSEWKNRTQRREKELLLIYIYTSIYLYIQRDIYIYTQTRMEGWKEGYSVQIEMEECL